jgi:hypothetical protein
MIQNLVVNGDSYMNLYAMGNGHKDLSAQLGIQHAFDLSLPGACNNRIIRTTYRHSYQTNQPTFYLLGMTFVNRTELPVLEKSTVDGHWVSFQTRAVEKKWVWPWTNSDSEKFIELCLKSQLLNRKDLAEDLIYKLLGLQANLIQRGHRLLVFRQAEDDYQEFFQDLKSLSASPVFVDGLSWCALPWQFKAGAQPTKNDIENLDIPQHVWHVDAGQHQQLNAFFVDYIKTHGILA